MMFHDDRMRLLLLSCRAFLSMVLKAKPDRPAPTSRSDLVSRRFLEALHGARAHQRHGGHHRQRRQQHRVLPQLRPAAMHHHRIRMKTLLMSPICPPPPFSLFHFFLKISCTVSCLNCCSQACPSPLVDDCLSPNFAPLFPPRSALPGSSKPFVVRVFTNGLEFNQRDENNNIAPETGNGGFCINFVQQPCTGAGRRRRRRK